MGLKPPREMAALAGGSEIVGGILTATGTADPLGPLMIAGAMTVATAVHRKGGPFAAKGGYEAALTNLAFAGALARRSTAITASPSHCRRPPSRCSVPARPR